jgi:hypothetical protein
MDDDLFHLDVDGGPCWWTDTVVEHKVISEENRILSAILSTDALNRKGHIMVQEGIRLENFNLNPVALWCHSGWSPAIGRVLRVEPKKKQTVFEVQFAETDFALELWSLYSGDYMRAWSPGWIPIRHEYIEDKDGGVKAIKFHEWELWEVSACTIPANPKALTRQRMEHALRTWVQDRIISSRTADRMLDPDRTSLPAAPQAPPADDGATAGRMLAAIGGLKNDVRAVNINQTITRR